MKKTAIFFDVINKSIIYRFFKDFKNHRKKTNRTVVFRYRPSPDILKDTEHR